MDEEREIVRGGEARMLNGDVVVVEDVVVMVAMVDVSNKDRLYVYMSGTLFALIKTRRRRSVHPLHSYTYTHDHERPNSTSGSSDPSKVAPPVPSAGSSAARIRIPKCRQRTTYVISTWHAATLWSHSLVPAPLGRSVSQSEGATGP